MMTETARHAEQLIREAGQKPTTSRIAVLAALTHAGHALTHPELLHALHADEPFDRVTLYRVLEWLEQHGLVHAIAGPDRARRFQATQKNAMHQHAHFKCTDCGRVFCLEGVHLRPPAQIPEHFTVESIELNLQGCCADCQH